MPTEKQLGKLAKQITQDESKVSPAEKRLKIKLSFKEAINIFQSIEARTNQ